MFSISQIFKYFSLSSVNSVAAGFKFFCMLYSYCIIMQSWGIEATPLPGGGRSSLSVCQRNSNSIWVEDFFKLSQILTFLNVHQFDIFCLTETSLDSPISLEHQRLATEEYKLSVATILLAYGGVEFGCILRTTCHLLSCSI